VPGIEQRAAAVDLLQPGLRGALVLFELLGQVPGAAEEPQGEVELAGSFGRPACEFVELVGVGDVLERQLSAFQRLLTVPLGDRLLDSGSAFSVRVAAAARSASASRVADANTIEPASRAATGARS
jgi:hypothetical protein